MSEVIMDGIAEASSVSCSEPWTASPNDVVARLGANAASGLSSEQAQHRLMAHGPNTLPATRQPLSYWMVFKEEIKEPLQLLLLVLAVLYFFFGQLEDAIAALFIILGAVALEVFNEFRAKKAVESLASRAKERFSTVLRDGHIVRVASEGLVLGDVLVLEQPGDRIGADARLLQTFAFETDEALLTGENDPVKKQASAVLPLDTQLGSRCNMVYADTTVVRGRAVAVVTGVALQSESGIIRQTVNSRKQWEPRTVLQISMKRLAFLLTITAVVVVFAICGAAVGRGISYNDIVLMGLSLGFATVPEELPILIKAVLAIGASKLAASGLMVKKLKTAESLGRITTILTDKTGTITESSMQACAAGLVDLQMDRAQLGSSACLAALQPVLAAWARSCDRLWLPETNAALQITVDSVQQSRDLSTLKQPLRSITTSFDDVIDPFDRAVVRLFTLPHESKPVAAFLATSTAAVADMRVVGLLPFDASRKYSVHLRASHDATQFALACRGSPEAILRLCTGVRHADGAVVPLDGAVAAQVDSMLTAMAKAGRVLGFASGDASHRVASLQASAEGLFDSSTVQTLLDVGLVFEGVIVFHNNIKEGVAESVEQCRRAGIRVIMLTGDHADTAVNVARQVRILDGADEKSVLLGSQLDAVFVQDGVPNDVQADEKKVEHKRGDDAKLMDDIRAKSPALHERIRGVSVFARVSPAQKLLLTRALQEMGETVLVTGDGFNDGPALATADVGVAMGRAGTDVARDAAGMVLMDDNFATLVLALQQGRRIVENLRKSLVFYLACKLALVLLFLIALASINRSALGVPLSPLQVILLEMLMDLGAIAGFTFDPADPDIMDRKASASTRRPHKHADFADWRMLGRICLSGFFMFWCVFGPYLGAVFIAFDRLDSHSWTDDQAEKATHTAVWVAWLLSHVLLANSLRSLDRSVVTRGCASAGKASASSVASNPIILVWTIGALLLLVLTVFVPGIQDVLSLTPLTDKAWAYALALPCGGIAAHEVAKLAAARWVFHGSVWNFY